MRAGALRTGHDRRCRERRQCAEADRANRPQGHACPQPRVRAPPANTPGGRHAHANGNAPAANTHAGGGTHADGGAPASRHTPTADAPSGRHTPRRQRTPETHTRRQTHTGGRRPPATTPQRQTRMPTANAPCGKHARGCWTHTLVPDAPTDRHTPAGKRTPGKRTRRRQTHRRRTHTLRPGTHAEGGRTRRQTDSTAIHPDGGHASRRQTHTPTANHPAATHHRQTHTPAADTHAESGRTRRQTRTDRTPPAADAPSGGHARRWWACGGRSGAHERGRPAHG